MSTKYARPVRFDESSDAELEQLRDQTGISISELVRRCTRFALPRFQSGEVNILDYGKPAEESVKQEEEAPA